MDTNERHRFWETFELVLFLFWLLADDRDAGSLACTCRFMRDVSYPRTWNHLNIPDYLPKKPLHKEGGGKDRFNTIKQHRYLVRSVSITDLHSLQDSHKLSAGPYDHYPFPTLQKLDVLFAEHDRLLDRFLPKTLRELNITLDPKQGVKTEIPNLVFAAKNLKILETFSLIRGTPKLEERIDVREVHDFVKRLPVKPNLKSFTIRDCTTTPTLARRVARFPSLRKLSLDLRFIKPEEWNSPTPPPSTAIDTLGNIRSVELEEMDFSVGPDLEFTLTPLARFPLLSKLTILVYGARKKMDLEPLLQLSLLQTLYVDLPDMGALVTTDLFNACLQAWTRITNLRLIDSGGDFGGFDPERALLHITALGMVGVYAPQLEFLEIVVDATSPVALPAPEKAIPAGCGLEVHWEDIKEDDVPHVEAYLRLLCRTWGGYGGSSFGTHWRNQRYRQRW